VYPEAYGITAYTSTRVQMARNARPTAAKREREKTLNERRQQKAARRRDAKEQKAAQPRRDDAGTDPDIAGIVPGPQPLADWQIEDTDE
jgi:hypothetical protein